MAAISYSLSLGQPLELTTKGTLAPGAGSVEIRLDQTATSITDGSVAGGVRALKKGEVWTILKILEQALINDPNVAD